MKISILTATYNRGHLLNRLYKSILNNKESGLEAEWIIIDDGSNDDTQEVVSKIILEKQIEVKYYYQENLGKMEAINKAIEFAEGDLIVDCDSDDYFTDDAFKIIKENASLLFSNDELYALCFLKQDSKKKISGKKFKINYMITTMFDLYFKYDIQGEKILVFNSKIRKKFKHQIENNEKFITEARMYHKMDEEHKILCINNIIEEGEYISDGYTKNISKIFYENPNGYYKYFKEILKKDLKGVKLKKKIYAIKHFLYFYIIKNRRVHAK